MSRATADRIANGRRFGSTIRCEENHFDVAFTDAGTSALSGWRVQDGR